LQITLCYGMKMHFRLGLPAKRAGKETNQEKRNALREFTLSKGALSLGLGDYNEKEKMQLTEQYG
jgi:hypothetical protein